MARKYKGFTVTRELVPVKRYFDPPRKSEVMDMVEWVGVSGRLYTGFYVKMESLVIKAPTLPILKRAINDFKLKLDTESHHDFWWSKHITGDIIQWRRRKPALYLD